MAQVNLQVAQQFPAGTKVDAYKGDVLSAGQQADRESAASGTVSDDGTIEFDDLEPNTSYVLVGQTSTTTTVQFFTPAGDADVDATGAMPSTNPGASQPAATGPLVGDTASIRAAGFDPEDPDVQAKPINPGLPDPADEKAEEEAKDAEKEATEAKPAEEPAEPASKRVSPKAKS